VTAMTGKPDEHEALLGLGASRVIDRDGLDDRPDRVLGAERFAGAIDCVGGTMLAAILRVVRWGGAVAASGLVGGATLETTVYPFITRNVALLGVDSVAAPASVRGTVWRALEDALDSATIEALVAKEVGLQGIAAGLEALERGDARRRILVDPAR
ncbi:MAG TPA: zinc-binding dehydrogenase, partial [Acidimicrobiales bacterium]